MFRAAVAAGVAALAFIQSEARSSNQQLHHDATTTEQATLEPASA